MSLPAQVDVVIIGGGVMGTSAAFHLAEAGVRVALCEKNDLASGSTSKAAGGVRDFAKMLEVRALGVSRVGASRTREMLEECRKVMGLPVLHTAPGTVAGY